MAENLLCNLNNLKNEASVEACFINPLLELLGYSNDDISFKESISEIVVGKGSKKILYKPDYVLKTKNIPTVVIDAKSPTESIENWESQCSSYCLEINKHFDYNPVQYYMLSNGLKTSLYRWDVKAPILTLSFDNFLEGDKSYLELNKILHRKNTNNLLTKEKKNLEESEFPFSKVPLYELINKFQKLHQLIWKSEKKGPSAAFIELIKIIFVKLNKDKKLHETLGKDPHPKYKNMIFTSHWILNQTESENPINDILFHNLIKDLDRDISKGKKKRFFSSDERINVSPETILRIVKELENVDLFGMEEDIHGRMFEAFLEATVRGKDIGQFFTPRDVVRLMVGLSDLEVSKNRIDSVLDACCGSGGFLIAALSQMLQKAKKLKNLTLKEKEAIISKIQTQCIYGIDAGSDPAMYKIARMNMYLHGDGGSNIFYADSLDKMVQGMVEKDIETEKQIEELHQLLVTDNKKFDIILSNPPFSMQYSREDRDQGQILNQYEVSKDRKNGRILNNLLSSVMFIERYYDLVADNGRIIAIIDDSVLSGSSYEHVRNYIREKFIIEGIISLPGDAFRRASARVKTSILILRKNIDNEIQEDVFLASAIYLGIEEKTAKRIGIPKTNLNEEKENEINKIITAFKGYKKGENSSFVYSFDNCKDRLDVKYCINDTGRKVQLWSQLGFKIKELSQVLVLAKDRGESVEEDASYQLLIVNYSGEVNEGELLDGSDCSYSTLFKVREWDILVSNMGFGRGAISIVPPYHSGKYVSNEYTILNASNKSSAVFYWNLLRSKEILGDILTSTTGMNRGRIKWDTIKKVKVPEYKNNNEIEKLKTELEEYWEKYNLFISRKIKYTEEVARQLGTNDEDALYRWLSFKPPE